jgi:predicted nucleic acid-binding protein
MTRKKRILDTNILIGHWRRCWKKARGLIKVGDVVGWARDIIRTHETNAIATPVYLEMIAGVTGPEELRLTQRFLAEFECVDEARILRQDWQLAIRLAQRVPKDGRPRQATDCLIRAIARRLKFDVRTRDTGFPG